MEDHIRRLEAKYFAGATTIAEERELRRLWKESAEHPGLDTVMAVISYSDAAGTRRTYRRRSRFRTVRVAAAATVLLAAGWAGLHFSGASSRDSVCIAYIGAERIDDSETVMDMMAADLEIMAEASETFGRQIADDFDMIREASATQNNNTI